jgi:hypothetical protein
MDKEKTPFNFTDPEVQEASVEQVREEVVALIVTT